MTKTVIIPQVFRLNAIDRFTREIVDNNGRPTDQDYIFDFSRLSFIDGSGYTVLSNTIAWLKFHRAKIKIVKIDGANRPGIQYLDDCGFFRSTLQKTLRGDAAIRSTTIPCTSVENAKAFSWIEHKLSPWLEYELNTNYASLASLRSAVKELFNNIGDHSAQQTGFVHAQHYPNVREIRITVSDFGVGIPTTIKNRFGDMSDAHAITLAAREGVTSQSRPNNMGAGLNYLIDSVTGDRGSVVIHSLSGSLVCNDEGGRQVRREATTRGSYPGTLVEIALDTRLFEGDDDERGDVEW